MNELKINQTKIGPLLFPLNEYCKYLKIERNVTQYICLCLLPMFIGKTLDANTIVSSFSYSKSDIFKNAEISRFQSMWNSSLERINYDP